MKVSHDRDSSLEEADKNTLCHPLLVSSQIFGTEVQESLDDLIYLVETHTKHMEQKANGALTHYFKVSG